MLGHGLGNLVLSIEWVGLQGGCGLGSRWLVLLEWVLEAAWLCCGGSWREYPICVL